MKSRPVQLTDDEIERVVNQYANVLFKLCFTLLGNNADAEDAVSDTFFKYMTKSPDFRDEKHKKAWLFKVATNVCRDMHRFHSKNQYLNIDDVANYCIDQEENHFLEEMIQLPLKYKTVLHLFYIEGYKTEEIAKILSISPSAARKRLQYAREKCKLEYEEVNL